MTRPRMNFEVGVEDRTKRQLSSIEQRFRKVAAVGAKAFSAASIAGATALTALTVKGFRSADALGKVSSKLGEIPSKIQGLQRAAEISGVSIETTNMALQRMVRRVSEAAQGTGEAQEALRELNLDARRLNQLSPADQFQSIAGAFEGVGTQADKVRLAMRLFDSEGVSLVNTLNLGEQALRDIQREIDEYGISLSRIDVKKIEEANDSFLRAQRVVEGFGQQMAVQVAPVVDAVINQFLKASKEAGGMGEIATRAFQAIIDAVGKVSDALNGISLVFKFIKQAALGAILFILEGLALMERGVLGFINKVTGSEMEGALTGLANKVRDAAFNASDEFQSALLTPPPSEKVDAFIAPLIAAANEAAADSAAQKPLDVGGDDTGSVNLVTDDEVQRSLEKLQIFYEEKFGIEELFRRQDLEMHRKHEEELTGITDKEEQARVRAKQRAERAKIQQTRKFFSDGFNALTQNSKKAFKLKQAYDIAETIVNTHSAAVGAYKALAPIPIVGPALGAAAAAAAIAYGAQRINAIKSARPGGGLGGGAAPSGGAGSITATTPDVDLAETTRPAPNIINIDFQSGITDSNAVREFIETDFAEALRDGAGLDVQVVAR